METSPRHRAVVDRLVEHLHPVRRLRSPRARLALWLALCLATLAVVYLLGLRPDLARRLRQPRYLLEIGLLTLTAAVMAGRALRAAVPGREPTAQAALIVGLGGAAAAAWFQQPAHPAPALAQFVGAGVGCALRTVVLAAVPCSVLLVALRRGAPLAAGRAGALAGGAGFLVAFVMMRLACPIDERLHLLVWHALPIVAGSALSGLASTVWLRRWRFAELR